MGCEIFRCGMFEKRFLVLLPSLRFDNRVNRLERQKNDKRQLDVNIVKYFINSTITLRAVNDPCFAQIFSDIEISIVDLTLINRRTLGRRINNYYEKLTDKI